MRVFHHKINRGVAEIAKEGIKHAKYDYITWFPGDNGIYTDSMCSICSAIGQANIILAYMENVEKRCWTRRVISRLYVNVINFLFGLNIKYYKKQLQLLGLFILSSGLLSRASTKEKLALHS